MSWITILSLFIAAIIHALPAVGLLGANWLHKLYGIEFSEPNTLLLMQHRAVLFGVVALVFLHAIFQPDYRVFALVLGLITTVSFVLLALPFESFNVLVVRVAKIDVVVIVFLVAGLLNELFFLKH
jgi:hypothetical protein